jgi:hypothetical protein
MKPVQGKSLMLALPLAALLAPLLALGGCAKVPMADPQADQQAKLFERPDPDRGALYIYRRGWFGIARSLDVGIVNGANAKLASNTYVRVDGPPGQIEVGCAAGDYKSSAQVEIAPGRVTYVQASMTAGFWGPHCEVAEVPPDQGQAAVRGSKRVVSQ